MDDDELDAALDAVVDETTFTSFVEVLMESAERSRRAAIGRTLDPWASAPGGWENTTIDGFLESMVGYAQATADRPDDGLNVWKRCASILLAGKFYE